MLLRHTTEEIQERSALTVNPAKACQPIGAMYAALGVHSCLPHSHGSQGCCAYHRSTLSRHYKEPIMAGTSSFTEGSSVFGGQANLLTALQNEFTIYDPEIVAIHTTCLSETIGDDMNQIARKAYDDGKVPENKKVVYCNTPSYIGSHVTGFANMVAAFVKQCAEHTGSAKNQVNVLPGWVEPADMSLLARYCRMMNVKYVMLPDTSGVLDAPQTGEHEFYPKGGTELADIKSMGDSIGTLACGAWASTDAAKLLDSQCKVPYEMLDLPIGISATDRYMMALSEMAGTLIPAAIEAERGRLMDIVTDMQQYFYGKRVALWGDPDQLIPLTEFLLDIDMKPVYVVSGTPGKKFVKRIHEIADEKVPEIKVAGGDCADMYKLHQWIKNEPVDLLIGNTYGKYIARDENIPFVRHGFPILDRIGHQYFPTCGYEGGMRLLERILSVMMDKYDRECPEVDFELVM